MNNRQFNIIIILLLTLAAFFIYIGMAHASPLSVAQTAWPNSPCTNRITIYPLITTIPNRVAEASGIKEDAQGNYHLYSCDIAVDMNYWNQASYHERCQILVHEAGHLAGLKHSQTGVMVEDHSVPFPGCYRKVKHGNRKHVRSTRKPVAPAVSLIGRKAYDRV